MRESLKFLFVALFPFVASSLLVLFLLSVKNSPLKVQRFFYPIKSELFYSSLQPYGLLVISIDTSSNILKDAKNEAPFEISLTSNSNTPLTYESLTLPSFNNSTEKKLILKIPTTEIRGTDFIQIQTKKDNILSEKNEIQVIKNFSGRYNMEEAANIAAILGNAEDTLKYANILIEHFPEAPSGYFYKAIGYEYNQQNKLASDAYRDALAKTKITSGEMPAFLMFKRFTALESK